MKKNQRMSFEQKDKISKSLLGHSVSSKTREKIGLASKGRHPVKEFKKGHLKPTKAYSFLKGKKHPFWRGGTATYFYRIANQIYREFHLIVICEKCGSLDNICIHHIDKNNKNNHIKNLQALCRSCHISLHKKGVIYGKRDTSN